jgi:hypothetical protein
MAGLECYECRRWFGVCQCPAIPPMRIENPFAFVEMFEKGNMMLIDKITENQVTGGDTTDDSPGRSQHGRQECAAR